MDTPNRIEIVLEAAEEGGWVVHTSIPGVHTQGETIQDACEMAGDAITLMLEYHS